ncbi:MAG: putative portal protein [Prokaryotic dsDNA virus sp.]|nr:MAG: putative portal protein [Prokaryotic dsDNA virus sp.]|tara:strand:- start:19950 stop:22055 length:2106 start_codon:yes stop_codon:yes gene_type:complete
MAYKKTKKKLTKAEELTLAKNQWNSYVRARDAGHDDFIEMAKKCDAYYRGDQWDTFDMQQLDDQGRPALTINTILPTINAVLGEQSAKKADIQFKPRGGGHQAIADVLTKVYAQISDNNKLDWVEAQVFQDGLIQDRGWFDVRIDFDDHVMGEVRIESKDPLDILIDPDAKHYDPRTWNEIFETKWMSLDEIEEIYGQEKADKLRLLAETGTTLGADSMEFEEVRYGDTDQNEYGNQMPNDPENARMLKSIRVLERQYYRLDDCMFFVDPVTGDKRQVPGNWGKKKREDFATQFGLAIIEKKIRKVRWTVSADTVVLFDDWSPYKHFTLVPYFPYFRRGKPFGMVRNLLSPQEQLNKITSQELHIVNTTANSGWIVESGSLSGMNADDLEEHGAETGLVLEFNRGSTPPAKIPPNQIPTGLDRLGQKASANIKQISGISDAMLGMDSPEVSGVAINAKQNRGSLMLQVPLDNLAKTRQYLAEKILNLVQAFYTEERIIQVTDESDPYKTSQPMMVNEMTPEGEVINSLTIGEYDVIVGTAPARDNFDEMQFAEAIELRGVGVPIPNDMIVEYSHLSRKADIADRIRQLEGTAPPTEEQLQLQQFQMESQIRATQLEIAKLEAEVTRTQTESALNVAKVEQAEADPQLKVAELQSKLQAKREELELRERLSNMTNAMRQQQTEVAAASKMAAAAMKTTGGNE